MVASRSAADAADTLNPGLLDVLASGEGGGRTRRGNGGMYPPVLSMWIFDYFSTARGPTMLARYASACGSMGTGDIPCARSKDELENAGSEPR